MNIKIKNSFVKKSLIYFVGTLSSRLLNVLLVPIYAFSVLPAELGTYDYVTSIANIAMPIIFLAIWEAILRFGLKNKNSINQDLYFSNSLFFFFVMSAVSCLITLIICSVTGNSNYVLGAAVFVIISGGVYIWQFSARALGESKVYVTSGLIGSAVLIAADFCFIMFAKLDFVGLLISYIISQIVIIIVIESKIKLLKHFHFSYLSKTTLTKMLKFSIPLVINNITLWFYTGGNKVIIQNYLGAAENGLYSFASRFSLLISLFSTVISMAVIEESYLYPTLEEYRTKIAKLISIISKAYFSLITLALPAIYILYSIAFKNSDYFISQDYIFMLLLASLFTALSNNFGSAFQVTDKTQYIVITTLIGAVSSISISLLLVGSYGVYGVLLGGVIGPFLMMLTRGIFAKKATGLELDWKNSFLIFLAGCVIYIILKGDKSLVTQVLILGAACMFIGIQYRNEISLAISKVPNKRRKL